MAGTNASKQPAVWVGGQRRRLVRRSGLPRSSTAPVLSPQAATKSLVSSVAAGMGVSPRVSEETVKGARTKEGVGEDGEGCLNVQSQVGAGTDATSPPYNQGPQTPGSPDIHFPATASPTPTTASASTTATEGKKKHGLFDGLKSRDCDKSNNSQDSPTMPVVTSPLPPSTPCKAAQFLGLEVDASPRGKRSPRGGQSQHDGVFESRPDVSSRQTKFKEEDVETDPPKTKKAWGGSSKKAMRVLGNLPSLGSGSRRTVNNPYEAASYNNSEEDIELGYNSDGDLHARSRPVQPTSRPVSIAPRRRMRRRGPKSLDRMSPITEASFDELRTVYRHDEDETELDVISEYEHDYPPRSASMLPQPQMESYLNMHTMYELDEFDLSPSDQVIEEEPEEEEKYHVHPGVKVDLSPVKWQLRSPLQAVEDRLLDVTEEGMRLESNRSTLQKLDMAKLQLNTENVVLREQHEGLRKQFGSIKRWGIAQHHPQIEHEVENDSEGDLVSICSSIDLEEEPTVHTAQVVTFTRVPWSAVKLVDIPPRKKKDPSITSGTSAEVKDIDSAQNNQKSLLDTRHGNLRIDAYPISQQCKESIETQSDANRSYSVLYDRAAKDKKAKMPREESRVLVHEWLHTYDPKEQRPLSERIDSDVLADQQIPPAPFPKENRPLLSPTMKPRPTPTTSLKQVPKHTCLNNGHIFHPIDLTQVSDQVSINSLEVRPYLQTQHGVRQHVRVPVFCSRCGEDVEEEVWECGIAVCRLVVCRECAEGMEREWLERAVGEWRG